MARSVITGGPCSGKTTVIEYLAQRGIPVVRETMSYVLPQQRALEAAFPGTAILPEREPRAFRKLVIETQLRLEEESPPDAICDVGILENAVYWALHHQEPLPELEQCLQRGRYARVFLFAPMPTYERNGIRFEDAQQANIASERIERLYRRLGYPIIRVPVLPVKERAEMVLRNITRTPVVIR